ncbi:MAG: hypothetical protein WBB37_12105 [bacterium]
MTPGSEKRYWRIAKYFVVFVLLSAVCQTYDPLKNLKRGDFDIVNMGKYRGTALFLRDGAQYKEIIDVLRSEMERNGDLLPKITRIHYDAPGILVYKFKFAALDSVMDNFILRYFARLYDHPILAGYQIQFVFNADSRELVSIFTFEVGLE